MGKGLYDIDYDNLPESKVITDPVVIMKLQSGAKFCKIIESMDTQTALDRAGLHKVDLSRIKVGSVDRFSLDRLVGLLKKLGYTAKVKVVRDGKEAS